MKAKGREKAAVVLVQKHGDECLDLLLVQPRRLTLTLSLPTSLDTTITQTEMLLSELRKYAGQTQQALADELGVSQPHNEVPTGAAI